MSRQICWTKKIVETFIEEACLTKEEKDILRTMVAGLTISEQAERDLIFQYVKLIGLLRD